jgi:undecaprenyl diphosphate synthase
MEDLPVHIAVIPDGNRRWAKRRHLPSALGHEEGVRALENVLETVYELGITCFSFWGASEANLLKRTPREVKTLEKLYEINFKKFAEDSRIHEKQVKVNVIGRWRELIKSDAARRSMETAISKTEHYHRFFINFFIAYDGVSEMVSAIERIAGQAGRNPGLVITPQLVKDNLLTRELPAVDLLIRTGGEPHLSSGFMMWDVSEAQLYFTEKHWPEFTGDDLKAAIDEYRKRQRRYGK